MADGEERPVSRGQGDQVGGFLAGGGDGLFHQHMGAGIEEGAHDLSMGDGGRADADQIDLAQQFAPVGNGGSTP